MRKSQIEKKLDQNLHRAGKRNDIEKEMMEEISDSNEEDNDAIREEEDFGLSEAQSYANADERTCLL